MIHVSGMCGDDSLRFYFVSSMVTTFDLTLGDADTISEGSFDFIVLDPQNVRIYGGPNLNEGYVYISDAGPKS
jgi:hypothetical protein